MMWRASARAAATPSAPAARSSSPRPAARPGPPRARAAARQTATAAAQQGATTAQQTAAAQQLAAAQQTATTVKAPAGLNITLNPTTAGVGTPVTVRGHGFGRHEQVTLALGGAALGTARSVSTAADGTFTATFRAPRSLVRGANTVSAMGNQTRRSAVTTLSGRTPVAARFYFAGGLNTARAHSFVQVLNTNRQPVRVGLTFYSSTGATSTKTGD